MKELEQAVTEAKVRWTVLEQKSAAQQRLLDGAAEKTQQQHDIISTRDEEIARLNTLTTLLTAQRDEGNYDAGRLKQALKKSEGEVRSLTDDIKTLDHQVANLRTTMGLENA